MYVVFASIVPFNETVNFELAALHGTDTIVPFEKLRLHVNVKSYLVSPDG